MKTEKNKAIITGASKGIGSAVATLLAREGIEVILLSRNEELLRQNCNNIKQENGIAHFYKADITNDEQMSLVLDEISVKHGFVDILVNAAGVGLFGAVKDTSIENFRKCIEVNLIGTFNIINKLIKDMVKQRKGQIINIESIAAVKGFRYGGAYVASKFALAGLTQVLWEEMKEYEVKVCSIRPGLVNTTFFDELGNYDLSQALSPVDVAQSVLHVVKQSSTSNISEIVLRPIKKSTQSLFQKILDNKFSQGLNKEGL
jgi:Short-chain alcohol dehydrogenase of unknown specificity